MDSCIEESKDYERYVQVGGEHFRMIGRPIKRLIARQSCVCMRAAGNPEWPSWKRWLLASHELWAGFGQQCLGFPPDTWNL